MHRKLSADAIADTAAYAIATATTDPIATDAFANTSPDAIADTRPDAIADTCPDAFAGITVIIDPIGYVLRVCTRSHRANCHIGQFLFLEHRSNIV